jgi:hypothetical protein
MARLSPSKGGPDLWLMNEFVIIVLRGGGNLPCASKKITILGAGVDPLRDGAT